MDHENDSNYDIEEIPIQSSRNKGVEHENEDKNMYNPGNRSQQFETPKPEADKQKLRGPPI